MKNYIFKTLLVITSLLFLNNDIVCARQNFVFEKSEMESGIEEDERQDFEKNRLKITSNQRKIIIGKITDLAAEHLEKSKKIIYKMPNLPEEAKTKLVGKIDLRLSEIKNEKNKVGDLTGKEEIQGFLKKIRVKNQNIKKDISAEISSKIKEKQFADLLLKIERIEKKISDKYAVMEKSGVKAVEIKNSVDSIKSSIENIKKEVHSGNYKKAAELIKFLKQDLNLLSAKLTIKK